MRRSTATEGRSPASGRWLPEWTSCNRLGEDLVATSIDRGRERQGVDGGPSASGVRPRWRRARSPVRGSGYFLAAFFLGSAQ